MISRAVSTLAMWIALGASAWACPVCFRMDDGPVSDGVRAAIVVLMGVTTTVLAGFAVFIRGFMRREQTAEPRNPGTQPRNLGTQPRNVGTPEPRNR